MWTTQPTRPTQPTQWYVVDLADREAYLHGTKEEATTCVEALIDDEVCEDSILVFEGVEHAIQVDEEEIYTTTVTIL